MLLILIAMYMDVVVFGMDITVFFFIFIHEVCAWCLTLYFLSNMVTLLQLYAFCPCSNIICM
mgnify:CR=1 FL=1